MAIIKLGQLLHKANVGPITKDNPLEVQQVGSMGKQLLHAQRNGDIEPATSVTLIENKSPTIIDSAEWATNAGIDCDVRISLWDGNDYQPLGLIWSSGNGWSGVQPMNMMINGSRLWEVVEYDIEEYHYKFVLKSPIYGPLGVRVEARNTGTDTKTLGVELNGRVF